ncbi:N-acetylmuramoyl-L-alanine amidase [Rummeliibacillus sp. TYF005]|uniref:DUF5776 domain-containing protein n=1 Tax=unclassified Rummeliibacillus TaxID=2622809 RepID=UPI000E65F3B1|nr:MULTISPECIES: DUF5776 domain-containing protein [unclassified Rummeliibacillus]RIJ63090.1 N-acetylmuramoyl-L-alanine amidase [Rummeliibacillus sp. POC4]RPJ97173.1 N-acetylmuramoyl-L-alanine amidase [Rummeliibacillus sp. TYF005]
MKVLRKLAFIVTMLIASLVTLHTVSAEELAPANPDHTEKWETEPITENLLRKASSEPTIADISYYQKDIDWSKASKVLDLVIIRTQYGSTFEDPKHATYEAGAKKYGVPFGVYAYSLAESSSDAKTEANNFYNRASKNTKFYVLDVEENTSKSGESMRTIINAYVKQLRTKTDKKIGLYIANHLYDSFNLDTSKFDFVWIPRYNNSTAAPSHPYDLWQYTDQGTVSGISTYVDLNRLNPKVSLSYLTGTSGITTASKPRYYTTNPVKIATKIKLNQYSSTSFTEATKGKSIAKNTLLNITGIEKTSAGTPRLKLTNGQYVTANRDYVVKVTSSIDQYYTTTPSKVLVKSYLYAYNNVNLEKKLVGVKKNTILTIKDLGYSTGGTPRLKTASGSYITASKDYVRVVTPNITNYIYVNPGKVQLKKKVYQYTSTTFTSAARKTALAKGKTYTVKSIVFNSNGIPRLKLANGKYITANKSYVVAK